jgi:RNA recognition motif-containing protein
VTCAEFRAFFEEHGKVLDSVVMYDHVTTNSRGFGFVTFADEAVCNHLIQVGRLEMHGKMVEIKAAEPKGKVSSSYSSTARKSGDRRIKNATPAQPVNLDDLSLMAMAASPTSSLNTSFDDPSVGDPSCPSVVPPGTNPFHFYPGFDAPYSPVPVPTTGTVLLAPLIGMFYPNHQTMPFPHYGSYYTPMNAYNHYPAAPHPNTYYGYAPWVPPVQPGADETAPTTSSTVDTA